MNFTTFIKSYENSVKIVLYYSTFDIHVQCTCSYLPFHQHLYRSESDYCGTVSSPDVGYKLIEVHALYKIGLLHVSVVKEIGLRIRLLVGSDTT